MFFTQGLLLLIIFSQCNALLNCNEAICASIVSKCMLTQSCKCDPKNSTCSRDCFHCLDYLFSECCSCVEMCKKSDETEENISKKSHIELLNEPIDQLFNALTEEIDISNRWVSYTIPSRMTFITHNNDKEVRITAATVDNTPLSEDIELNCTVLFMTQCVPFDKCKDSCKSMGATSSRWFHDGCCECVGPNCLNFGIQESRCEECPLKTYPESNLDNEDVLSKGSDDEDDSNIGKGPNLSNNKDTAEHPTIIDNLQSVD